MLFCGKCSWYRNTISRVEIASRLELNKSTVTHIVNELLRNGIILQAEEGISGPKGGRKPVFLILNKKFGCVIGFEIRPQFYIAVATDLDGEILFYKSERIEISSDNFEECFLEIMSRVTEEQKRTGIPLLGIGVGVSGIVDPVEGVIRYSIPLDFIDEYNFKEKIASRYDVPFFLENDANCCSWGELVFHRKRNLRDFLFVLVEFRNLNEEEIHEAISVGLGIVIDGKVHYGNGFFAGEFRSAFAVDTHNGQFALTKDEIILIEKDPDILNKFFKELGKNLALLINTFNLSHVFLGGDIEKYRPEISEVLKDELKINWPFPFAAKREIMFSSLGDRAVAFGAAGMVLNRLFVDFELAIELKISNLREVNDDNSLF